MFGSMEIYGDCLIVKSYDSDSAEGDCDFVKTLSLGLNPDLLFPSSSRTQQFEESFFCC